MRISSGPLLSLVIILSTSAAAAPIDCRMAFSACDERFSSTPASVSLIGGAAVAVLGITAGMANMIIGDSHKAPIGWSIFGYVAASLEFSIATYALFAVIDRNTVNDAGATPFFVVIGVSALVALFDLAMTIRAHLRAEAPVIALMPNLSLGSPQLNSSATRFQSAINP
jgi:hypothetical protein